MRALAAVLALALALPLAAPARAGGPFGAYPVNPPFTPRWVDAHHNGTIDPVCCAAFVLDANATDPDDSGLYDTLRIRWIANASTTDHTLYPQLYDFLPPGPAPPERVDAFSSANATAFDSTTKDVFNDARFDANLTLRTARYGNVSARAGLHCFSTTSAPGPEACAIDPLAPIVDFPSIPPPMPALPPLP